MTAFNYAKSGATAKKLIERFGMAATINRVTNSGTAYDPTQATTGYPCLAVMLDYSDSEIDGSTILRSDRKVYVAAVGLTIEPSTADKLLIGGVTMAIASVKKLAPAGVAVYFELQCRR